MGFVDFDRVAFAFAGAAADRLVLADISLQLSRGEFFCLLGPSGCGKTTLLNLLAGFEKPSDGAVQMAGAPRTSVATSPCNGRAVVQIDRQYLQTVNTEKDYHVFLTARGNPKGAVYVDQETPSSFEIRESTGTANIKVSYRIVAKRKDFADERLTKVEAPLAFREPDTRGVATARPALQSATRTAALP